MRAAAEVTALIPERSADPLEHVDYRLVETPEEKDEIYRLRYRAYLREGAILPSESQRVRYRTVGDMTCTAAVESNAASLDEVINEIIATRISERGETRIDDKVTEAAMEDRKKNGYF